MSLVWVVTDPNGQFAAFGSGGWESTSETKKAIKFFDGDGAGQLANHLCEYFGEDFKAEEVSL